MLSIVFYLIGSPFHLTVDRAKVFFLSVPDLLTISLETNQVMYCEDWMSWLKILFFGPILKTLEILILCELFRLDILFYLIS